MEDFFLTPTSSLVSLTPMGCLIIQFSPDTNYPELAQTPQVKAFSQDCLSFRCQLEVGCPGCLRVCPADCTFKGSHDAQPGSNNSTHRTWKSSFLTITRWLYRIQCRNCQIEDKHGAGYGAGRDVGLPRYPQCSHPSFRGFYRGFIMQGRLIQSLATGV